MRISLKSSLLLPFLLLASCSSFEDVAWFSDDGPSTSEVTPVASTAAPQEAEPQVDLTDTSVAGAQAAIQVREQKQRLLAQQSVAQGDYAFERGDYKGAVLHYADAFRLSPSSIAARDGLRRSQAALGGENWDFGSSEELLQQEQLRWARERMRVEGLLSDGDRAMGSGDFGAALRAYQGAELALQYSPNIAGSSLDLALVQGKIQSAQSARVDTESAIQASELASAKADIAAQLEAEQNYFSNIISSRYSDAAQAFSAGRNEQAVSILDDVLRMDPNNSQAAGLRDIANRAYHAQRSKNSQISFREEWKRTFEELRGLTTPPKSAIEHDRDHWLNVVKSRENSSALSTVEAIDPATAGIQAALDTTSIEANFELSVEEIANNLAAYSRVNFVVSRMVRDDLDEDEKMVTLSFSRPMPISQILTIIEDLTPVRFKIRNGAVNVLTVEEAASKMVLQQYEVRDLTAVPTDFPLPEINLVPSNGVEATAEEPIEREARVLTDDQLIELITANIDLDSWEADDPASATIENGTLIVRQRPENHAKIRTLLNELRQAANIMVEVRVRFIKVEDSFLQDIGIDLRGLGNDATSGVAGQGTEYVFDDFGSDPGSPSSPGTIGTGNDLGAWYREADDNVNIMARNENLFDSKLGSSDGGLTGSGGLALQYAWLDDTQLQMILRAVEKSKRSEMVVEPRLMVHNTSRANVTVANQVSYVADFEVQIAQAAAMADPIVRVARDGIFLDVRPTVTADRLFTWLEIRPTIATLKRPIPTFQTSLGTGSPVTLMLPELELQKIRTRALVPDGGTLLLGGMKMAENQEIDSGVPFLNQIPVLSFFFSRKGNFESYKKLIILLTAHIILPEEYEPVALPGELN